MNISSFFNKLFVMMTSSCRKPTEGGEIKPSPSLPVFDDETNNKEFLVVTLYEGGHEFRVPFLVNYETSCRPNDFQRLIALDHKSYKFYVITINNQNSSFTINNENGKLKFIFDHHVFSINKNKTIEEKSGYNKDFDQVISKSYDYDKIPNRPNYYNSKYKTLVPENFNIYRDQLCESAGQDGVDFIGIFSLIDTEIRMPILNKDKLYEFFSIARCYAAFRGNQVEKVYAVPVPKDMKCYVNNNDCTIRMVDSTDDVTYKVDSAELSIKELKILTNNVFRFKVIITNNLEQAMITGLSRLKGLDPHDR